MHIIKPDQLSLLYTSFRLKDDLYMSIATLVCFTLDSGNAQQMLEESRMWQIVAAELGDQEALDLGLPKQRGEYLVYGSALAQAPAPALRVEVTVGGMTKTVHVSGDRHWTSAGTSEAPQPFTEMPISWTRAYGGPNHPSNPRGIGMTPDATGKIPVPNIQDEKHPIVASHDQQIPAGFNAWDMFWPQRKKYLGDFNESWRKNRWPHYPVNTDPEYFNAGPVDQRMQGFFKGDEPLRVTNMNQSQPALVSGLPGVRARIFVNRMENGRPGFHEARVNPETVWLFPNQKAGVLLFRAVVPVADEELDDVIHLIADLEPLSDPPQPIETYAGKLEEIANPAPVVPAVPNVEPAPEETPAQGAPPTAPTMPPTTAPPVEPPAVMAEIDALLTKGQAQLDAVFKGLGMTREEALDRAFPKSAPAPVDSPERVQDLLAKGAPTG